MTEVPLSWYIVIWLQILNMIILTVLIFIIIKNYRKKRAIDPLVEKEKDGK